MGDQLRLLREYNGMTISELAEKIDVSNKMISNYENGYNRITIETIVKIYNNEAFGNMELEEIFRILVINIFE
ncbi:Helix-turn-helix [Salibacterium qingdaonense]|uniref:Helix-turn-helix n=2 Tax=Salibacterium qingdaonense TaxID=266892 RepID=A0A1I4NFZ3_9BACI|nr:Helix-turn-helix [Salibacterium qingdaonense]